MESVPQQPVDSLAIFPTLLKFHVEGRLCDVTVQSGNERFSCYRVLLAAMSEFFNTMFQSDFKEGSSNNEQPIVLHEVHPLAFKEILNLIHTDHINIDSDNVHLLLQASDFLQLRTTFIEERCFLFLSQEVNSDKPLLHALDVLSFTFLTKKQRFVDLMCDHVVKYVQEFAKDVRFMEIHFDLLNTILFRFRESTRTIDEERGNTLLNVILCWVNHSRATRRQYRNTLMKNINSSCISTDYALSLLMDHEELIDEVKYQSDEIGKYFSFMYKPGDLRHPFTTGTTCRFEIKNFTADQWQVKASLQRYRIRDLLWSATVQRSKTPPVEYLSIYVKFDGDRDTCLARVSYMVLSQKDGVEDFEQSTSISTYFAGKSSGLRNLIKWDDIIDKKKGYIKDDCVIFQFRVSF